MMSRGSRVRNHVTVGGLVGSLIPLIARVAAMSWVGAASVNDLSDGNPGWRVVFD